MMKKQTEKQIRAELARLKAQLELRLAEETVQRQTAKKAKKTNGFKKGTGAYSCEICTRMTRDTGVGSIGCRMCPNCWEIAGFYNEMTDYGVDAIAEAHDVIRSHLANIVAKGGKLDSEARELAEIVGFKK